MYTGQFVYYGRRTKPSIGDVLPLYGILKGAIIFNIKHHTGDYGVPPPGRPGTMPSSSAMTPTAAPLPGHPGTMPSSSAATLTTTSRQEVPPAEGRPQRTMTKSTMLGTLQCPSSFGTGGPSTARVAHTISSTLDDL
ncbi:uncharacterized protein [Miscanthus floridulus]|uniref:uncharacterized protein n=1 Tax=Miscanthus floridulus TaxID=154761 RepID=UPI00345ADBD8